MPSENPQILLRLEPAQLKALKSESEKTGAPMAEIIRRALSAWLEKTNKLESVKK